LSSSEKEDIMCASCGCGKFEEDHGDDRNLTLKDLKAAAQAADISTQQVVQNLNQAAKDATETAASRGDK
jgi:hypothetical protein